MSRPYHHGDLKPALLEAAEAILRDEGMAALTLRAIARRAGVSHAAPKHHFGDLNGLLSALAAAGYARFARQMTAAMAPSATPARAAGRAYVEFALANRALFLLMFADERIDAGHPALRPAMDEAFAILAGTATPPAGAAENDRRLLVRAARNWALVHGFAMLRIDRRLAAFPARSPGLAPDDLLEEVLSVVS